MDIGTKPKTACILWQRSTDGGGYGKIHREGKFYLAHRLAYCQANNLSLEDIKGKFVRHACDVRRCVNPDHLVLGTHQENMDDMMAKGRHGHVIGEAHHCAKLTEQQVLEIRALYRFRSREYGLKAVAKKYGVAATPIHRIVKGKTWKHLLPKSSGGAA